MNNSSTSSDFLAYIPHGHCYLWKSELISLHVISDAIIAIAYFSIPCTLGYFVSKRKDLPYPWIFALFGAFIISCGVTHILEIWTLWHPTYWLSGSAKALTAAVSMFTAVELFPIVPQALALTSPAELEAANQSLKHEIAERQQVEVALKQSQQLLDNAFEYALIGNALVSLEGNWIKVNPALCDILGYSRAELLDTNFRDITYLEGLEADQNYINQLISGEISSYQLDKRFTHKQGHIIWVRLSVGLGKTSQGQPLNFIFQIDNITRRKQAEQDINLLIEQLQISVNERTTELGKVNKQLKVFEANYQDLYNNAPDMFVSVDAQTSKVVQCNQTLCDALHFRKSEIVDQPIFDLYHPDCHPQADIAFQAFVETGEVKDAQLQLQRKDGSKLDVSLNVRAVRDENGKILYSRSSWRDITERKRLEAQLQQVNAELEQRVQERTEELQITNQSLRHSQEQLELAFEASGDGWWHWHVQTGDLEWSPQWYRMLNYEDNELPACYETWKSLVHPEDMTWVKDILNAHLQDDSVPYSFDYRVRTKEGEWKWIFNLGKVIERDEQSQPLRMAGMHHDMSDRKQAEAERLKAEKARQELTLLEKILNDILAGYWDWDIPQHHEYLSPGFKRMLGYQDHELPNTPESRQSLIFPEDLPVMLKCMDTDRRQLHRPNT